MTLGLKDLYYAVCTEADLSLIHISSCETKDKQAGGFAGRVSNIAALSKLYL